MKFTDLLKRSNKRCRCATPTVDTLFGKDMKLLWPDSRHRFRLHLRGVLLQMNTIFQLNCSIRISPDWDLNKITQCRQRSETYIKHFISKDLTCILLFRCGKSVCAHMHRNQKMIFIYVLICDLCSPSNCEAPK